METRLLQLSSNPEETEKVRKVMDTLSRTWSIPLIMRLDRTGELGFNELRRAMRKITAKTLSKTLADLVDGGIVDRRVVPSNPPRVIYSLSSKGDELIPLLTGIAEWDEKWQNLIITEEEISSEPN